MKFEELSKKSKEELMKQLKDSKEKIGSLRFDLEAGKVKNVSEIRQLKKDIARIFNKTCRQMTNLSQKMNFRSGLIETRHTGRGLPGARFVK